MKKVKILFLGFIFIINTCFLHTTGSMIKNEGIPGKGEWAFDAQKLWSVDTAGEDLLVNIVGISIDDNENIYLCEQKSAKIFVFSGEGKFKFSIGRRGEGPGEFRYPMAIFLAGEYLIVQDIGDLIHYFTKKGNYVKSVKTPKMPNVYLDDFRFVTIELNFGSKSEKETLEIYDLKTNKGTIIAEITTQGILQASSGSGEGSVRVRLKDEYTTPMVVMTVRNKHVYFGRNDKYLIKKIDLTGKELFAFSLEGRKKKEITMSFKKKRANRIKAAATNITEEMLKQIIRGMGDYCNFFQEIYVDDNGLIYIYIMDVSSESKQEIDIFSPQGKYLYHSEIQLSNVSMVIPPIIKKNYMLVFEEDEEGERKFTKYKIKRPSIN